MSFITLPTCKLITFIHIILLNLNVFFFNLVSSAPPIHFINTTYLLRSVTLDWDQPVRLDQNGEIVGYNLTCIQTNLDISPETMFTIPVLVPFTNYTCKLSSINVVGEGPAIQFTFKTAQDSKFTLQYQFFILQIMFLKTLFLFQPMFTIPMLLPFTEYTCKLSSINVVGEGPATQFTFKTAQNSKFTSQYQF